MHIPFDKLPLHIQKKLTLLLEADDFAAAKNIRDRYEEYLQKIKQKLPKGSNVKPEEESLREPHITD